MFAAGFRLPAHVLRLTFLKLECCCEVQVMIPTVARAGGAVAGFEQPILERHDSWQEPEHYMGRETGVTEPSGRWEIAVIRVVHPITETDLVVAPRPQDQLAPASF